IGGLVGSAHIAAYNMSKAADINLVKSLAMEWGKHNIRVNCIAPGLIQTDFAKALWDNPEIRKANERKAARKRICEPDVIGGVAVFLASKAGNFVCGQTIIADGGVIGTGAECHPWPSSRAFARDLIREGKILRFAQDDKSSSHQTGR